MLTNEDGTEIDRANPIRVTDNDVGKALRQLSPDAKKIVFDSNRDISGPSLNIPELSTTITLTPRRRRFVC